jgi:glycosyltransferase involved in cell wall biosynthesis
MRVLAVLDSLDASGGAERSLAALAPALVSLGLELHVGYLRARPQSVAEELQAAGSTVHSLCGGQGRLGSVLRVARLSRMLEPDLVHTTLFEADQAGRVGARLARRPVVTSLVSDAYSRHQYASPGLPTWKLKAAQATDAATAHLAVRFHAITSYVAEVMAERLHIERSRIDVVPRGRDPHSFGQPSIDRRRRVRREVGVGDHQPLVVAVGRQEWQKGHDVLIDATSALLPRWPEISVLIAGRSGQRTDALRERIADASLGKHVRILGFRDDVPDLLSAADVFALPSRWEGLGSTLLEAMALGVPIVASDLPAVREVVTPAESRLVRDGDAVGLADAINDVLGDAHAARCRAFAARDRFLREFTIDRTAKATMAFYERALASAYRP